MYYKLEDWSVFRHYQELYMQVCLIPFFPYIGQCLHRMYFALSVEHTLVQLPSARVSWHSELLKCQILVCSKMLEFLRCDLMSVSAGVTMLTFLNYNLRICGLGLVAIISSRMWCCRIWTLFLLQSSCVRSHIQLNSTLWPESASELYRPSDRRLSAKLVPTFADRGCHVVIDLTLASDIFVMDNRAMLTTKSVTVFPATYCWAMFNSNKPNLHSFIQYHWRTVLYATLT
jgi:hypothetical protein